VNESNGNNNNTNEVQLPEAAKGPAIPPKGYLVEERCDHSYWVTDGSYNTMFLVTDKGVVAVDAPPSLGQKYLRAIAEVTDKPVNYMIYSHAHIDHIGAAGLFPKNVTIIAQDETARELQSAKAVAKNVTMVPPLPTITFSKNYTLEIGNQPLNWITMVPIIYQVTSLFMLPNKRCSCWWILYSQDGFLFHT
jgi:glyoxylase-like metal-dependent hydrolase (beta-lactamase superfamily II)